MATMEAQVAALRSDLDPTGKHSPQKIWAALKALGLEPEDLNPVHDDDVQINKKIPDANTAEKVKCQRLDIWEGLRDSRIEELRNTLAGLGPDDVRRYQLAGDGVRPVKASDLPPSASVGRLEDFETLQERKYARVKAEQQRQANQLVTVFLQEKKRMEEADAKIAASAKRLAEKQSAQEAERKTKRNEAQKKEERRQQQIQRCAQERLEYEDETETKIAEKLARAAKTRAQNHVKSDLQERLAANEARRQEAQRKAVQLEEELLNHITDKQERLEDRLEERRIRIAEDLQQRAEASQAKFHGMQLKLYAVEEKFVDETLSRHKKFQDNHSKVREARELGLKAKSKSCSDILRKAKEKQRSNYDKLEQARHEFNVDILQRHQAAAMRTERLKPLKLKCGGDVHTFQEVKYGTWGELQRKRYAALTKSRDAHTQALLYEIAEFDEKTEAMDQGHRDMHNLRQQIAKESLTLRDHSREGFIKIKRESDERKIHGTMTALGFTMPTLPDEDEEQGEEGSKPAF